MTAWGTLASVAIHLLIYFVVKTTTTMPNFEFEFELPAEVEFGLTEEMLVAATSEEITPDPSEQDTPSSEEENAEETANNVSDGGISDTQSVDGGYRTNDAGIDSSTIDAAIASDSATEDSGSSDAGVDASSSLPEDIARLPPGAQLALRMDMQRIRDSALAPDVQQLLQAIPDWQLILDGSGIDPINDLEKLLIASPNLQRSRMVLAGRHAHGQENGHAYIREVVRRFGETRNVPIRWRTRHGVPTARWPNRDETQRVIAIVGPQHFSITRSQDLRRLLSIGRAREARGDDDESENVADALLSMGEGDALTLEVEGAREFLQMGDPSLIPTRLRLAIRQEEQRVHLRGFAIYDSPTQANDASSYWEERRARYASNTVVQLVGMSSVLRSAVLEVDDSTLRFNSTLTFSQVRVLLGFLEGQIGRRRRDSRRGLTMEATPSRRPSSRSKSMNQRAVPMSAP